MLKGIAATAIADIKSVEVEIGGQKIDKHYGTWLDIYDELFEENPDLHTQLKVISYL